MRKNKEGRKLKSRNPMDTVAIFIMPTRSGASLYFTQKLDITECERYIKKKRGEGLEGFGMLHLMVAAYIRTVSQHPALNRFIRGQRTWARNNVEVCLTVKKHIALNEPETVIKLIGHQDWTADDTFREFSKLIADNKQEGDTNSMDGVAKALCKIPSVLLKGTIQVFKFLDYFCLLPRFLTLASPFHCSMFITSMGSLGIPPIYHHLYDFGNCPVFISTGIKFKEPVTLKDGTVEEHKFMEMKVVLDERICDGQYYASSFKLLNSILQHPDQLDNPPEKVEEDIK